MSVPNHQLIRSLEQRFERLTAVLYDTAIPPAQVDAEVTPYLAEDVRFVDPWQQASGRQKYRLGAAGFHCMFRFTFNFKQVNVTLDGDRGRAIVDGVMQLKQFQRLLTFPLRTILVYSFELTDPDPREPRFLIHTHEEMWSLADMIDAVPGIGRLYSTLFRPAFSVGFLAASKLSCRAKGLLPHAT